MDDKTNPKIKKGKPARSQEGLSSSQELRRRAHTGDMEAQFVLGKHCLHCSLHAMENRSEQVRKSKYLYVRAVKWFSLAADTGHDLAREYLIMCITPWTIMKEHVAVSHDPIWEWRLGEAYVTGLKGELNLDRGIEYLSRSASKGHSHAMKRLEKVLQQQVGDQVINEKEILNQNKNHLKP